MRISKRILISLLFIYLFVNIVSAETWKYGSLHQHTGYSTNYGYDGNFFTSDDNCFPLGLEANAKGYEVYELKEDALDKGLSWLAFSDHSYCIDSSEFNTVKTDCQNSQDSSFICLIGEEVSAAEIVDDTETITRGFVALGIIVYLNEKEAI